MFPYTCLAYGHKSPKSYMGTYSKTFHLLVLTNTQTIYVYKTLLLQKIGVSAVSESEFALEFLVHGPETLVKHQNS